VDVIEDDDPDAPRRAREEIERLRRRNAELEDRLHEAEDTLAAIRGGDVDALVVGDDVYTLDSANAASNAMRKDVLAQMQDAVLAFDAGGHLIFMNPAAEAQYGRGASEMLGRPRGELYEERWADDGLARRCERALREQGTYRAESVHVRGDGRGIHVEATVARLDDAHGQPLGTLCVIRDIGERIEAQARLAEAAEELARRERRFSTLVENSPDIFARMDRQLRHLYVSPVIERYTGLPAAAFLGKSNADLGMPPHLVESWARAFAGVFETGNIDRVKFRFVAADGEPVDFESRLIPEFAEDGTIESVLSIASNVTEQARVDAALSESKARLEFTLAAARVGEWEIDVDTGACRHSALFDRCFGLDAPRTPWNLDVALSLMHDDDRERVRAQVARCFATREVLDFEARVNWPDASVHWIHVQGSAYVEGESDAGRGRLRYLGIISDVTARKHDEAALRDADARKDEFLATLAHELRNPLAPIRNSVQLMQLSRDEGIHENARRIIERQLKQMVHLVDDLLDISRISQGKVELRREIVDLASVVMTAVETSRPLIDAGHHELTIRLGPPRALRVDADVTRLCQILANLLNNAAKYTPEGGRIEVTAERDGAQASICVRDSGIGISKEMLPRVFDMFAQVDRSMERAQGGLGIGLALVKRLVEMHGGSVSAHSDGPDLGCRFVVQLPLVDEASERPDPAPAPAPGFGAGAAAHQRVLVVDDNVDSAESLSQMLAMLGYETSTAHDGVDAVEAARTRRPAIVLMDIGMPRMNGLDAARAIRQLPGGDRITLIALSGWGQHEDRRRSSEAGFDHHFVKPLDVEALMGMIAGL
jgi:PAS domain S-box-containing protein